MRRISLFGAPAVVALTASLTTTTGSAGAGEQAVPAGCPSGTVHSVDLLGDDFNPDAERSTAWDFTPGYSTMASPTFAVVKRDGADGDMWRMHVDQPTQAGRVAVQGDSPVKLPAGRKIFLVLRHEYHFPYGGGNGGPIFSMSDGAVALVPPGDDGHAETLAGRFTAESEPRTSVLDVSRNAGKTLVPRFTLSTQGEQVGDPTGWDIDDVALYTCDGATASTPVNLTVTPGTGRADLSWQPPTWTGYDGVTGYRITVHAPAGSFSQVLDVGPEARNFTVANLPYGETLHLAVQAVNSGGTGTAAWTELYGTSLSISSTKITYGVSTTVRGVLKASTGALLTDKVVKLQARKKGATTWASVATQLTSDTGAYSFPVKPASNYEYRTVRAAEGQHLGTVSPLGKVTVRQRVSGQFADSSVRRGQTIRFAGSVAPNHAGGPIYLQRLVGSAWQNVMSTRLSSTSTYSFSRTAYTAGTFKYRTYRPGDADHAAGYSLTRTLTVN